MIGWFDIWLPVTVAVICGTLVCCAIVRDDV